MSATEFPISGGGFVSVGPLGAGTALGPMTMGTAVGWQYVTIPPPHPPAPLTREQVQAIEDRAAEAEHVRLVNERRVRAAEARGRLAVEEVRREAARLGGSLEVDPLDVLLQSVREAWANVAVLRDALQDLEVAVAEDGAIALPSRDVEWDRGGGTHVPARVHVLVAMYGEERDRAARYSKLCLDAGVDERRVRVAEQQAQVLGQAIGRALDDGEVALTSPQRQALRAALARELRALGAGA